MLMKKKSLKDIDVDGKTVLVRVDFNVPLDRDTGEISDDSRIRATVPTIRYLQDHGAHIILCSHMGRPKGKPLPAMSLAPVATRLREVLGQPVTLSSDATGQDTASLAGNLRPREVLLLENLRFHAEEEANDPEFAQALASLAQVFVNDAFGTAHRAHASTEGVTHYLPAVAGFLMEKELEFLGGVIESPARPLTAIIGGAKVSDKCALAEHMIDKVDSLIIGGGMCATFFKARGYETGDSLLEPEMTERAAGMEALAKDRRVPLLLPVDVVIAERFHAEAPAKTVPADGVPHGWLIMDIGPQTVALFSGTIASSKTIIWNGPMGVFEMPRFSAGTHAVARAVAAADATTVVGGGSTAQVVHDLGLQDRISHVSTGGGASLELLEGRELPGVAALLDRGS